MKLSILSRRQRTRTAAPTPVRIDREEALHLMREAPLFKVGRRAFDDKRARFGDTITYVVNRHVNPTNLCIYTCAFCDFAARPGDDHAYSLDEAQILSDLADRNLREVHLVGGLWPKWGLDRSLDLVRQIREARPDLWIKAFTAVEIAYFARMSRISIDDVLCRVRGAGVDALPGGGAEVLSERVHQALYPQKSSPADWLAIHEAAHRLGMPTNATLLFGHIETPEELVGHLFKLRDLQDRTGGFQSFIPLAYQPGKTRLAPRVPAAPHCLRVIALSRLVLDNIPHIKAYWPTLQLETAAAALSFGADDLDGTLGKERIMQLAQTESPSALSAQFLESLIREGGQEPAQRTGAFRPVTPAPAPVG